MLVGLSIVNIVMAIAGIVVLLIWLILYIGGLKYYDAIGFDVLDDESFPLKQVYGLGYSVLEKIHYTYKTKSDRKLRQVLEILYSEDYAEFYLRVYRSEQIGLASLMVVFAFPMYYLTNSMLIFFVFLVLAVVVFVYYGQTAEDNAKKRAEVLLYDFSDVISKLALLTNAGSTLQEAWTDIAYNGETIFYKEMQKTVDELNNNISMSDALYRFGARCMVAEIKKFVSTVIQSLNKGNADLAAMLMNQSKEAWSNKKQLCLREGQKAGDKLLVPMLVMFIGVLILIVVPIFAGLGI